MNKNAEHENLEEEIAVMPKALEFARQRAEGTPVILARLVKNLSLEKWNQACKTWPLSEWRAFPVEENKKEIQPADEFFVSPFRDVRGALTALMFERLLNRELKRLERNGGSLALLSVGIADQERLETALGKASVKRLNDLLGNIILSMLDSCDSLGMAGEAQFLCSLPGMGQLAARDFAERCQHAFEDAAKPFFPSGGVSAGKGAECSIGIVTILQTDRSRGKELIKRAKKTLEAALARKEGSIQQETASAPLDKTTLVQSQEKQFLFFGGDPS